MSAIGRLLGRFRGATGSAAEVIEASRRVDRVAPWLLIGPDLLLDQYEELRRRGVTHVLDLRDEGSDDAGALEAMGFRWLRIPVADRHAPSDDQLTELVLWLDSDADPNVDQALYVHCHAGLGRTPTIAMALLMQHDLSLAEAHRMVLAARPESAPTPRQLEWLRALQDSLRQEDTAARPSSEG